MAGIGTVLITGASSGIGFATTKALLLQGARVIMACRNAERTEAARRALIEAVPNASPIVESLDLGALKSVRGLAQRLVARGETIDVLLNNAGVYCNERAETEEGFERSLGVNYLGPLALSLGLLPCLRRARAPRIIQLASNAHYRGRLDLDDLQFKVRKYDGFRAYATSKLAVVMGTRALAKDPRADGIAVYSVHPGHAATNIWPSSGTAWRVARVVIDLFLTSAEDGAAPSVHLASAEDIQAPSGTYFDRFTPREPDARALDDAMLSRLWTDSLALIGAQGSR